MLSTFPDKYSNTILVNCNNNSFKYLQNVYLFIFYLSKNNKFNKFIVNAQGLHKLLYLINIISNK